METPSFFDMFNVTQAAGETFGGIFAGGEAQAGSYGGENLMPDSELAKELSKEQDLKVLSATQSREGQNGPIPARVTVEGQQGMKLQQWILDRGLEEQLVVVPSPDGTKTSLLPASTYNKDRRTLNTDISAKDLDQQMEKAGKGAAKWNRENGLGDASAKPQLSSLNDSAPALDSSQPSPDVSYDSVGS